ncbi:MAG: hypothetical protein ABFD50_04645 [Smithella sp.]
MFKWQPLSDETVAKIVEEKAQAEESAELANELRTEATRKAMALARACRKVENPTDDIKNQASQATKRMQEVRQIAKEKNETAAQLRRIACKNAVLKEEAKKPDPILELQKNRPLKPPTVIKSDDESNLSIKK